MSDLAVGCGLLLPALLIPVNQLPDRLHGCPKPPAYLCEGQSVLPPSNCPLPVLKGLRASPAWQTVLSGPPPKCGSDVR
jgi:hypothetical protein